ncbi:EndoU domain-containing protein [Streptomyces sp. G-G2]|uniref:EndoU domain-containing protein n=1 Tax=Streptomyces sp. G-G2 TaxID=3046201 RepID=UPI0024BBC794|nr:EndoU domain-containing protein [Streptomyces sp. G-G2]MDJ0385297.1 EndoU domain-containing protein [Streptomyces sp. G-G2]
MTDDQEPYHPRNIYDHEATGRDALPGRFGGWEEVPVDEEDGPEITPELRSRASYLSPFRMDHIAELHSGRAAARNLGKSLFPSDWTDEKIFQAVQAVASDPSSRWTRGGDDFGRQPGTLFNPWHNLPDVEWAVPARFRVDGSYGGVKVRVVVEPFGEGVISAYTLAPFS